MADRQPQRGESENVTICVDTLTPKDENGVIRLAQISDPHLFANKAAGFLGINPWQSLNAVVSQLDEEGPLDLLLATGDISQDHSATAYLHFAEAVAPLALPTYALPGNHDAPGLMSHSLGDTAVQYGRRIQAGNWQILMLDSTVLGLPAGHLALDELRWLHGVLSSAEACPTLIALHHHPKPTGCAWLDQHGLDNGAEFLALLSRYPQVKAVIWGHVHQEMDIRHEHIRLLAVPSTSIQFLPKNDGFALDRAQPGYRMLSLHPDGTLTTEVKRLHGTAFVPDPSATGY
ncbi:3',5'-cyclic-AMP phosphodiesterase [Marinobacter hydrocarbonoclasticus]|nr:3',5'-cyclic-AMP phosphodiesterase [Marinobacter nauticus]